jgi:hypothetical protein
MIGKGIGRKFEELVQLAFAEHTPHESAGRSGCLQYSPKIHFKLAENC